MSTFIWSININLKHIIYRFIVNDYSFCFDFHQLKQRRDHCTQYLWRRPHIVHNICDVEHIHKMSASQTDRHQETLWVFGYGSLLWKPDFQFSSAHVGYIEGYTRRFYQGNQTFRGKPGQVRSFLSIVLWLVINIPLHLMCFWYKTSITIFN